MRIETVKTTSTLSARGRFAALGTLGLLGIGLLSAGPVLASPAQRRANEPVLAVAAQDGAPASATTAQLASDLDFLAQGLAKLLKDPAPLATLRSRMAASPLPENTVRFLELLSVKVEGSEDSFGALLANEAGITEEELRATLAAFPVPITLFFPEKKDRRAVLESGEDWERLGLQVTWDPYWLQQKDLKTVLAYDPSGQRTRRSVTAHPAVPVLVVSTENSEQPEPPPPASVEKAAAATATATSCINPYLELVALYLVNNHEGGLRGGSEFELYLGDWDSSMPGHNLLIRPTTPYQFSGRYINDAAGRSRYLLDMNDSGRWYTFNPPIAMFEYNPYLGTGLYAVEDDSTAGVLKLTGSYSIGFTCSYFPGCTGSQCQGCQPTGSGFVNLARAILGAGDDRFDIPFRSVGGAPMDTIMEASMGDWRLRYRVACPF